MGPASDGHGSGGRSGVAGPSASTERAQEKQKDKDEPQPVPFEYFIALLECIAEINHPDWPHHSEDTSADKKYRQMLANACTDTAKKRQAEVAAKRQVRRLAVSEAMRDWIIRLPAGEGPGPQACLPGTTAAIFRLLFPEEDIRRRYGIKESKMLGHLVRALNVPSTDPAARALYAWADPEAAHVHTTGSGCLAIEFARQMQGVGLHSSSQTPAGSESAKKYKVNTHGGGPITLQQIDILLDELAAWSTFSEASVRACWDTEETTLKEARARVARAARKPGGAASKKPGRPKQQLHVLQPSHARLSRFQRIDGTSLVTGAASKAPHPEPPAFEAITFDLPSTPPTPEHRRKARLPREIIDFLLSDTFTISTRTFLIQILLKDLDPVLYPLPKDDNAEAVVDAESALRDFNTRSVARVGLYQAMLAWHPAMPSLWKLRCGSSFADVAQEVEAMSWDALLGKEPMALEDATASIKPDVQPRLFTFVQMPKSLKAQTCVGAAQVFDYAGILWAEQKYDGERFQVHVRFPEDGGQPQIKIFSKSQRDSTQDRAQTHGIVLAALGRDPTLTRNPVSSQLARLAGIPATAHSGSDTSSSSPSVISSAAPARLVAHTVILDAEMVAVDAEGELAEFHKIAKVKDRAGMPVKAGTTSATVQGRTVAATEQAGEERFQQRLREADRKRRKGSKKIRFADGLRDDEDEDDSHALSRHGAGISQISDLTVDGTFHLGLVFFDVLHLDGQSLIKHSYEERRHILESIIRPIPTYALLAERTKIDFGSLQNAQARRERLERGLGRAARPRELRSEVEKDPLWRAGMRALILAFAHSYVRRQEGLMLKAADGPYVGGIAFPELQTLQPLQQGHVPDDLDLGRGDVQRGAWVKLKADYIAGLGDSLDMAVVGAGWSMKRGRELRVGTDTPTTLYLAARLPDRKGRRRFRCWTAASYGLTRLSLLKLVKRMQGGSVQSVSFNHKNLHSLPYELELGATLEPNILFREPLLAEVVGGGFSKDAGEDFYMLRWPRVTKLHFPEDRSGDEAVAFEDAQRLAIHASRALVSHFEMEDEFERRALQLVGLEGLEWLRDEIKAGKGRAFSPVHKRKVDRVPDAEAGPATKRQPLAEKAHVNSTDSLARALEQESEARKREMRQASNKKMTALQSRAAPPQHTAPRDSPIDSSPMRDATRPAISADAAGTNEKPSRSNAQAERGPLPAPFDTLPAPLVTPPNSSQDHVRAPAILDLKSDAPGMASGSTAVAAEAGPGPAAQLQRESKAVLPRACASTPRLMDAAFWFHSSVPEETRKLFRPWLLHFREVASFELIAQAVSPVLRRAPAPAVRQMQQRGLVRSRSANQLQANRNEGPPTGIVIMDTSDTDAKVAMWAAIRQLIQGARAPLTSSVSAPSGLSVGARQPGRMASETSKDGVRVCMLATTEHLNREPIMVVDLRSLDPLGLEQWDCVKTCAERGPAAAAGECECCQHIDKVLTTMAKVDPASVPKGSKGQRSGLA